MAAAQSGPRKQRTRQHIIADLSVHHVERYILETGHTAHRLSSDYGYDLLMTTFDENGYVEPGSIYFQFKAMENLTASGAVYVFDLDVRDYNLWIREHLPVILILFDATRRRAYWQTIQTYFNANVSRRPRRGARHVRIRVPQSQVVNRRAIARFRLLKQAVIRHERKGAT